MNSCNFIGRIGRDAETRSAGSSEVTSWPVAIDVGYGDKKSTLWLDCAMWGDRGSKIAGYIRKGDNIGVSGELSLREYQKDGQTKTTATLRINDVKLLGGKQEAAPKPQRQAAPVQADDFDDSDVSF